MPGPQPTPSAIKAARGTLRASAARSEPTPPAGPIEPLAHVAGRLEALGAWRRIAPLAEAMGVLTTADTEALALGCLAWAEYAEARSIVRAEGPTQHKTTDRGGESIVGHPAVAQAADAWRRYLSVLDRFGLNPAARSRVIVEPKAADVDPFGEFERAAA